MTEGWKHSKTVHNSVVDGIGASLLQLVELDGEVDTQKVQRRIEASHRHLDCHKGT